VSTVPREHRTATDPFHLTAALRYAERAGWAVLWLATDGSGGKVPPRNCERCDFARGATRHDMAACECLTCHSFHAATRDPERVRAALALVPGGHLAIRTGTASRLLVVDAEAHAAGPDEPTGLEVLESWESWTGGEAGSLPPTLAARSVSGGLHLFYRLPAGEVITSGRILPSVDVKAEGGYVGAVDGRSARRWVEPLRPLVDAPPELLAWLSRSRRRGTGGGSGGGGGGGGGAAARPDGYDFRLFKAEGCPDGYRDYFFNALLFQERKAGATLEQLLDVGFRHWGRCAQPPDARYEMPWEHVEYKARRVFHEVAPEPAVTAAGSRWAAAVTAFPRPGETAKIGSVTVVGRRSPA
jgi:hypothetical protein